MVPEARNPLELDQPALSSETQRLRERTAQLEGALNEARRRLAELEQVGSTKPRPAAGTSTSRRPASASSSFESQIQLLYQAESRFQTVLEQIPVVFYLAALDHVGSRCYVSLQVETLLGFPALDWTSESTFWFLRLHREDQPRVMARLERSRVTGEPFTCEYRMLDRVGREIWVRDEAIVLRGEDDAPLFLQGMALDITAQKRAELALCESQLWFRRLVELVPAGVLVIDAQTRTIFVSERLVRLLGSPAETLLGRPLSDFLPEIEVSALSRDWSDPAGPRLHVCHFRRSDGSHLALRVQASPLHDERGRWMGTLATAIET